MLLETPLGPVEGGLRESASGVPYVSVQGYPYAAPPVANLRFRPPQLVQPWTDPLDLSEDFSVACPQKMRGQLVGREDCLYMNIYVPQVETDALLPVMVWIYGGGFINGYNMITEYGPEYYVEKGIIVVVPNYRTGVLGFFSLGTEEVPGNQGLLDQLEALKTVQSVITSFGGDPNRVTLAGQSAGSSSTLYQLTSPKSTGLYQQVIAQSGSNFSPSLISVTAESAQKYSQLAADAYGCLGLTHGVLECMEDVEASKLANLNDAILVNLKPNEDGAFNSDPFMPSSPMDSLLSGNYNQDVKVLIGTTKDDGIILTSLLVSDPIMYSVYRSFWTLMAPGILFHRPIDETTDEDKLKVIQLADFYLEGTANINDKHFENITQMFTDAFVTYAAECFVSRAQNTQTVYQYLYEYNGEYGLTQDEGLPNLGVGHADELYLQWNPVFGQERPLNPEDQAMSAVLQDMWSKFIIESDPGHGWEPATSGKYMSLKSGVDYGMEKSENYAQRMQFWQQLFPC